MDDEFELISKAELRHLRTNQISNSNSKTQTLEDKANQLNSNDELVNKIVSAVHLEGKKDRELIINELSQIKDLNKSTLSNVLDRTDKLDIRVGTLIDTISDLVNSIKDLIEENSSKTDSSQPDLTPILDKLSDIYSESDNSKDQEILQKLQEVEAFMNNLKILLSQIKPNDMKLG